MNPLVIRSLPEWTRRRRSWPSQVSLGFVPTMGALHEGHGSLVQRARAENEILVVSIFVNPTQFNDPKDLEKYPRTFERDLELLSRYHVDYVFAPDSKELYPDSYRYRLSETGLSQTLCGAHRPGHFDGVLTVVMKLLNLIRPKRAYFGEKDYQQLELIRGMVAAFFMDTHIIACPTLRAPNGLALSSRNELLDPESRDKAHLLFRALTEASNPDEAKNLLEAEGFQVDYVEETAGRRFGAAHLGPVRLIDNVEI